MTELLNDIQIQQFINYGYLKIENAFTEKTAKECIDILWKDTGCDPDNPATWTKPVIWLGDYSQECFKKAINTSVLHSAFDKLIGNGNWLPRNTIGSFPIRFPAVDEPGDTGWHAEASFPGEDATDFFSYRININSKGRALLMLFIFSDIGEYDAPTRIREGSHLDVAKILQPYGESGLSFMELAQKLNVTAARKEVLATGLPGTVYLCHPFLVHAAQPHHGKHPRFMAQPPLIPSKAFSLHRIDNNYCPVELAIRKGMGFDIITK